MSDCYYFEHNCETLSFHFILFIHLFILPEQDWVPGQASGAVATPEETELKPPDPQREQAPAIRIQHQSVSLNNTAIKTETFRITQLVTGSLSHRERRASKW